MEALVKETNELLKQLIKQNQSQNELLTAEQVHKEYGIGINMVRAMFNDKQLPVQRYTVPFKVSRKALEEYMTKEHDYLRSQEKGKKWDKLIDYIYFTQS